MTTIHNITVATLHFVEEVRYKLAILLCTSLLVLVALYVFFLTTTMLYAVENREAIHHAATVNASIATLERNYLDIKGSVTFAQAQRIGLIPLVAKSYVTRSSYVASVVR